jgi:hypothetical protein
MPVIGQFRIYREDLRSNPSVLYLFGDNDIRKGLGGQAGEMRGEPNAVGVRTKWFPDNTPSAYFNDLDFERVTNMIYDDLERARNHLAKGGIVIIPLDGLGTGLSKLPKKAPLIARYLAQQLAALSLD